MALTVALPYSLCRTRQTLFCDFPSLDSWAQCSALKLDLGVPFVFCLPLPLGFKFMYVAIRVADGHSILYP